MTTDFDLENLIKNALNEAIRKRGHINVLIAGATGVGKSTLINAVFQGNFAETGQGRPVTQSIREITKEGIPLSVFDSRGLEMDKFQETLDEVRTFISQRSKDIDPQKHIHLAWVCILEDSRRVQEGETELVKILDDFNIPVIAIITKIRSKVSDQGFKSKVQEYLPTARNVVRVRALAEEDDDGGIKPPLGLETLIELSMGAVPEGQKSAFAAAQKVDLNIKKNQSHAIVATAALSAAGLAAVPIPFSDAVAIVPIQVGMLASITGVFGLSINKGFLATLISSITAGAGGSLAGRAIVSGLLKLVPGVGSVAGGAIASVTAAGLTTAFGEAYIAALELLFIRNNGEPPTAEEVASTFKQQYALAIKK